MDHTLFVQLDDGRRLAYQQLGDPAGPAVLYFHGFPGSRLEADLVAEQAGRAGARVLSIDRPGIGCSDPRPGRTIADWPSDVAELADRLALSRFAVVAASGGSPYALACALQLHTRLTEVVLLSALSPLDRRELRRGLSGAARFGMGLVRWSPALARAVLAILTPVVRLQPGALLRLAARSMSSSDRELLARGEVRRVFERSLRTSFRSGAAGPATEVRLISRRWDLDLSAIAVPVAIWHGDEDRLLRPRMARWLADVIPTSSYRSCPGEGHYSLVFRHAEEILRDLVQRFAA